MKSIYKKLLFLLIILPFSVLAQSTLNGTVVDSKSKQSIPGVNVSVQGSTNGISTDFDGKFTLKGLKPGDKINFSFVGYKKSTITFTDQKNLTVSLIEDSNELKEVVVQVGYGSVKKKDATGSVALVTAKDFNKGAIVSADQLLAGKAAGVRITNSGGSPDATPNIRIRGGASLSASNNPLIIIDGVPIGDLNPAGVNNPFTLINPNDIESFSILKDASATAIYGIRGSNGVILITTKKGTTGAPQFSYSANLSIGTVDRGLNVMNAKDFTRFINEYYPTRTNLLGIDDPNVNDNPATPNVDEGADVVGTPEIEGRILSDTNWQNEILRTAISTDHNFSVRANLYKKIPFRASIGYTKAQGLIKTNDYQRFNYSVKLTPKLLKDNLKLDINAKGTVTDKNNVDEGGALGGALSMDPTKPVYGNSFNNKFDGYYQETRVVGPKDQFFGATNPLALLNQRTRPERVLRFLGNIELDYKIPFIKNLRFVTNLGLDASQAKIREVFSNNALATYQFNDADTNPQTSYLFNPGLSFEEYQTSTNTTLDSYGAYSKTMSGFISKFDLQAGYSYQNFKTEGDKLEYRTQLGTGLRELIPNNIGAYYYSPVNLQGFFGRTNVDVLKKYLFTATLRYDGTSLFVGPNQWSLFPAAGFAWKVKEENFLKNSNFVQELKIRAGWGKTGNATLKDQFFPSRLLFTPGNINSQYLPGFSVYSALNFNPDLTWEKTTTINFGLDFEFFKNSRFSGSFDYYTRKTNDLLSNVPFAAGGTVSGNFFRNIGSLDSNGVEFAGNIKVVSSEKFSWNVGGNIAYNISKIVELKGITITDAPDTGLGGTGVSLAYNTVGEQPSSALVYQQIYNPATGEPIVGAYKDLNGDGQINGSDQYYKPLRPNWTYGFNTTVNFGNFDFAANFRGQIGGQVYNLKKAQNGSLESAVPQNGNSFNNILNVYDGTASPLFKNYNGKEQFTDYLLENASFLRCDNISLSYKFNRFIKKSVLRLSIAANNAFIITKYTGLDPENFNGIDGNVYPRPRTFTFGLNLDF